MRESMRLIDLDKFLKDYNLALECKNCERDARNCQFDYSHSVMDFCGWLDEAPTIDAVPVVHGKWELAATEHNAYRWQVDAVCSCCGFVKQGVWGGFFPDAPSEIAESVVLRYASKVKLPRYCETCGAKMDGKRREADEAD